MQHDSLCSSQDQALCLECAQIVNIREDERYRVMEQLAAMPPDWARDQIADAIKPITGDVLRRKDPRADLGFGDNS